MKKIILLIIVFFISIFVLISNVSAVSTTLPERFDGFYIDYNDELNSIDKTINGADFLPSGEYTPTETRFKISTKDTDNRMLYCSDGNISIAEIEGSTVPVHFNNCKLYSNSGVNRSLVYIFENGYGNYKANGQYTSSKYLTGDPNIDYYITQMAIWEYTVKPTGWFSGFDFSSQGTFNGKTDDEVTKMANLVQDAKNATKGASLSINLSNTLMKLTDDNKYYITDVITLYGEYLNSNITANISGNDGAFITGDKDASIGITEFQNGSKVYIKVPVNNVVNGKVNIKLIVSATTYIEDSQVIECQYTKEGQVVETVQPMIIYYKNNSNVTDEITVSASAYPVTISKKDSDGNYVTGATLVLKKDDRVVETWDTVKANKIFSLAPGKYTIQETKIPVGYFNLNSSTEFTLDDDGKIIVNNKEVKEIVLINNPIIITISKRIIKNENELSGAVLRITDEDGKIAKDINGNDMEWTTGNEPKSFHIAKGSYVLEEVSAPEGYELSDKKIQFKVSDDGTIIVSEGLLIKKDVVLEDNLIVFENSPVPEQVPTGNRMILVSSVLCVLSFGISIYFILKRKEI